MMMMSIKMTYMAVRRTARAASCATYSRTTFSSASLVLVLEPGLRLGLSMTTLKHQMFTIFQYLFLL